MQTEYAAPIDHSRTSALATTAFEAGKSGLIGMIKGVFSGTAIGAAIGGGVAAITTLALGIGAVLAAPGIAAGAAVAGSLLLTAAGIGLAGATVGAVLGTALMAIPPVRYTLIGIGTAIGLVKGASNGMERVSEERAAAAMLNAQIEAHKAATLAQAQSPAYSQPAHYNKPAYMNTASTMAQAPSTIQAGNDNVQYDGRIDGQQLATAR